ncbi:ubiquitin carboxyl-terminal hydrolase 38-like [Mytilus galloprovincialis]|uniref:ubiquitin carboxyl-terminal hydrolase 38-like n=1 Tax=Mytilus galloprovincialis TaxID=29158 RepID=UPI003F7C3FE7
MDALLNGILSSKHPDQLKKQLLHKIADKGAQPQAIKTIKSVFELTINWYLEIDNELASNEGLTILKSWAKHNLSTFEQFFDRDYLVGLLLKKCRRECNIPILVKECLHLLQRSAIFYSHLKVVEAMAINYVQQHPSMASIVNFISLLRTFKECIPKGDFTSKFCVALINGVALIGQPDGRVLEYIQGSELIFKFINALWNQADSRFILESLKAVFTLISDESIEMTFCLGAIVQHIPKEMIDIVVKYAVFESNIDDDSMTRALNRIIGWIQWPTAVNVSVWIIGFLQSLAAEKRFTVLISVTEDKIEQVFKAVELSQVRKGALNVLTHMLLSFQHSPEPFHKILPKIPRVMSILTTETSAHSQDCAVRLAYLIHCCMYHHAGYPDLYDPVMEIIKEFPQPDPEEIQKKLAETRWTNQKAGNKNYVVKVTQRSETGKTGLHNLGNTCFMNSIVQALFMADGFRRSIFSLSSMGDKNLSTKLQQLFAFLSYTQRPAYAPINFLAASRPPWFTAGHQQDCSEFLKYLLDQIHEEEKTAVKKKKLSINGKQGQATTEEASETTEANSVIEDCFGGQVKTTYTCLTCKTESSRTELFTDLPLAFPEYGTCEKSLVGGDSKCKKSGDSSKVNDEDKKHSDTTASKKLHLNDLVQFYFKPEKMTGDNKYFCEKCGELQDAERSIKLKQVPDTLIFTLLRFSYDAKKQRRTKIFRDVKYPRTLVLPSDCDSAETSEKPTDRRKSVRTMITNKIEECGINTNTSNSKGEIYSLFGVIIHSGVSSESGHYYCYARHSLFTNPEAYCDKVQDCKDEDEIDFLQNKWYLFNDSSVSHAHFNSFSNVTQRFTKDTPYILLYKRITPSQAEGQDIDLNKSLHTSEVDPPMRADLRALVNKDNTFFLQEQETAAKTKSTKKQDAANTSSWFNWNNDDDNGPPGSCGGGDGGSGFGGLNGANRFIF